MFTAMRTMGIDVNVEDVVSRRCNKVIAIILRYKDEHLDPYLPEETANEFRTLVLDQINDLHDLFVDLLKVSKDDSAVVNEHYLALLEEVHVAVTNGNAP